MNERRQRYDGLVTPILQDLYRFARRLERDAVRADDLLQQCLLTGLYRFDQLKDEGAFRVWISRILYRSFLNNRKKRVDEPMEDNVVQLAPPTSQPDSHLVRRRLGNRLSDALDRLPDDQREAVWLIDGQGFKYAEAADILECAPGTVASRVARGRIQLRRDLRHVAREQGVIS